MLIKRTIDEMITHFNKVVSEMDIPQKDKMTLLGMITAIGWEAQKNADALEVDEKRIAELSLDNKMLKNTIDADKGVMLDRIRFLEAQLPKHGEWISVKDIFPSVQMGEEKNECM